MVMLGRGVTASALARVFVWWEPDSPARVMLTGGRRPGFLQHRQVGGGCSVGLHSLSSGVQVLIAAKSSYRDVALPERASQHTG